MSAARQLMVLFLFVCAPAAQAEVLDSSPHGFTIQHESLVTAERSATWSAAIDEIGQWWNASHTVSGNANWLSIDARPMGCFCEDLPGNDGIVHMVVTSVSTDVMIRLTGGLGPLGLMGVDGNMTWEFFDDVVGTRVRFTYTVGGYWSKGLDTIAEPVDMVIGEALELLKAHVESE